LRSSAVCGSYDKRVVERLVNFAHDAQVAFEARESSRLR
jgi:hypothetical protein